MIQKPMLAAKLEPKDIKNIRYPILCTPKLDGIRCIKVNGKALSRSLKPIRNTFIRTHIEKYCPDGFDGEITLEKDGISLPFNEISSAVMSEDGEPDFTFAVFDYVKEYTLDRLITYTQRMKDLKDCTQFPRIKYILPTQIDNEFFLLKYEEACLVEGFEGIILRSPNGLYKFGRSTLKEGYLIKLKRFTDGEALILSLYEKMHNTNAATTDALGHTKRSSHLAGQVPAGTLGGFWVRDLETGEEFGVGTGEGLDDKLRAEVWNNQSAYIGKLLKFKSQLSGAKDKPRFGTYIGFRDPSDI